VGEASSERLSLLVALLSRRLAVVSERAAKGVAISGALEDEAEPLNYSRLAAMARPTAWDACSTVHGDTASPSGGCCSGYPSTSMTSFSCCSTG
jgi:hypothetical protein